MRDYSTIRMNLDLLTDQNNGTMVVKPTMNGILKSFCRTFEWGWEQRISLAGLQSFQLGDGVVRVSGFKRDGEFVVFTAFENREKVWVFGEWQYPYGIDESDGYEIDERRREMMNGTLSEGRSFVEMCRRLGFNVGTGAFVPFSNGTSHYFKDEKTGEMRCDYPDYELAMRRNDLPTEEELKQILIMQFC